MTGSYTGGALAGGMRRKELERPLSELFNVQVPPPPPLLLLLLLWSRW